MQDDERRIDSRRADGRDARPSDQEDKGVQAEKGDQRRDKPVHHGTTRPTKSKDRIGKRSGSESNEQQ